MYKLINIYWKIWEKKTEKNNMKYNVSVPLNGKQEKNK